MKDAETAIEMLRCAHRRVRSAQRCEEFMRHVQLYSPQYIGLAYAVQRELLTARMLLQAARRVHPATTPKGKRTARPVTPKAGPAQRDAWVPRTLISRELAQEKAFRLGDEK